MAEGKEDNTKLFDRIGDHYNNPEMSDRILVVKVRKQGWEMLRAAKLARNIGSSKQPSKKAEIINQEKIVEEKRQGETSETLEILSNGAEAPPLNGIPGPLVDLSHETLSNKGPAPPIAFSQIEVDFGKMNEGDKNIKYGTKRKKNKSEDSFTMSEDIYTITFDITCPSDKSSSNTCQSVCKSSDVDVIDEAVKQEMDSPSNTGSTVEETIQTTMKSEPTVQTLDELKDTDANVDPTESDRQSTVLREYEIRVHSFWLALNSSYFRGLFFSSGMKETRDKKVAMNVIEDMSAMFMILIESLYRPDVVNNKSVDDLLILMRLSHIYDTDATLKSCQKLLATAELSIPICDNALNMHEHERLVEMDEFIKRCEQFLVEAFSPLDYQWTRQEFFSLSATALNSVLSSNDLCVSSENTVFLALMRWADINEVYEEALEPLLDLVCFKAMTINYLHDVVTSNHPIVSTVAKFPMLFEEAVFFHAFSKERQAEEGDYEPRKAFEEPILFNWHVENYEDTEFEKKKKIIKSPHFWVSGYEMFLELKLRSSGYQGLYLTICTQQFNHDSKGFVKLKYSLSSNFLKATHVFNEVDIFDKEGSGWGYEEFFPLTWPEFRDQLKRSPLIITAQVRLLE